jgi:predicted patatin/cPLA2 family phospholipase
VLRDFSDPAELRQAVRASAALPRLGGEPPVFRGERTADGALIEPIPFRTAITEGATHVLGLRSRPAGYRKPALSELGESIVLRDDPRLVEPLRSSAVSAPIVGQSASEWSYVGFDERGRAFRFLV